LSHLSQASWCVMVTSPSFLTIEWGKGEQHSTANCPMLPGTGTNCKTLVIPPHLFRWLRSGTPKKFTVEDTSSTNLHT
jgi:hypothetical protein